MRRGRYSPGTLEKRRAGLRRAIALKGETVRHAIWREMPTVWQVYGVIEPGTIEARRNIANRGYLPLDTELRIREDLFDCGLNDVEEDDIG